MRAFISYSTKDLDLVNQIANRINGLIQGVKYWDKSKEPGEHAWNKIHSWIDEADIVFVLITGNTVERGISVGMEVGRAKKADKLIIPIVSKDILNTELGFLSEIAYQPIDLKNPIVALDEIEKALRMRVVANQMLEEQKKNIQNIFVIIAILCIIIAILSKE